MSVCVGILGLKCFLVPLENVMIPLPGNNAFSKEGKACTHQRISFLFLTLKGNLRVSGKGPFIASATEKYTCNENPNGIAQNMDWTGLD